MLTENKRQKKYFRINRFIFVELNKVAFQKKNTNNLNTNK